MRSTRIPEAAYKDQSLLIHGTIEHKDTKDFALLRNSGTKRLTTRRRIAE